MTDLHLQSKMMSEKVNVLLLGNGGRENALAWKFSQSTLLNTLHIAPGNGGTDAFGTNVNIAVNDFDGIANYCLQHKITIVVVGPEDPLVKGIVDYFAKHEALQHIYVFGPDKTAAQLEGSKDFSKQFMFRHQIPTAKYQTFVKGEEDKAIQFLETLSPPYVLKADGLAAGKGVLIVKELTAAKVNVHAMLGGMFGEASAKLVIEEFLDGIEVSYFAMSDGANYVILPEAKDYKRIGEGDTGLNTGGMGAVSPVPFADEAFTEKVIQQVIKPTFEGFKKEHINYVGFLFFGLIKVNNEPKVIEYNCRMGDPETEVVLPRIESDLLEAIVKAKDQKIADYTIQFSAKTCTTVIAVSKGYPEEYEKGKILTIKQNPINGIIFHAGTHIADKQLKTNGGRVIASTGLGENIEEALKNSYQNLDMITYEGMQYRKDIGQDLLKF